MDKTDFIPYASWGINGFGKCIAVIRPAGLGKGVTAGLPTEYYCCGCGALNLLDGLSISWDGSSEIHMDMCSVLFMNTLDFITPDCSMDGKIATLQREVCQDIMEGYGDVDADGRALSFRLLDIYLIICIQLVLL